MKMRSVLIALVVLTLYSCGSGAGTVPKTLPGAGGAQLYEMMEEDSTEQKADSAAAEDTTTH